MSQRDSLKEWLKRMSNQNDIDEDYAFARAQYYKLAEQGQDMIEVMFELFRESEHPRAGEVLAGMLKQNADIADKLMELQKKKKEVQKSDTPQLDAPVTNNNLFVGSTTDLQRMLTGKMKDVTPEDE